MDYFFGTVPGSVLIQEPALRAVLITFVIATILGAGIGFMARRLRTSSGVAKHQVRRLGSWLFWMGAIALGLSLFFYEDALFTKRIWLYLMLALVYAVGYYALYFYFTQYPGLDAGTRGAGAPAPVYSRARYPRCREADHDDAADTRGATEAAG